MKEKLQTHNTASKARRKLLGLRHISPSLRFGETSFKPGPLGAKSLAIKGIYY